MRISLYSMVLLNRTIVWRLSSPSQTPTGRYLALVYLRIHPHCRGCASRICSTAAYAGGKDPVQVNNHRDLVYKLWSGSGAHTHTTVKDGWRPKVENPQGGELQVPGLKCHCSSMSWAHTAACFVAQTQGVRVSQYSFPDADLMKLLLRTRSLTCKRQSN